MLLIATPGRAADLYWIDAYSVMHGQMKNDGLVQKILREAFVKGVLLAAQGKSARQDVLDMARSDPGTTTAPAQVRTKMFVRNHPRVEKYLRKQAGKGFAGFAETPMRVAPRAGGAGLAVPVADARLEQVLKLSGNNGWPVVVRLEFGNLDNVQTAYWQTQLETLLRETRGPDSYCWTPGK